MFDNVIGRIWKLLSSVKLALILILIIGGLSLIGAFSPQIDVFHSWWFLLAGALLILNILVCNLNRWSSIRLTLSGGKVQQEETFYASGKNSTEIKLSRVSPVDAAKTSRKALRKHGYRVRSESDTHIFYLAADKNRYQRLGTFASHLSLILLVLAYILGSYLGFREPGFEVVEGNTRDIGYNTGLSLQLVSFVDEYYSDGTPKDYRSDVILYQRGNEVNHSLVRVNHPLSYDGVRIYQSFFGPAIQISISKQGTVLFQGGIPLDSMSSSNGLLRYYGSIDLSQYGLFLQFVSSGGEADSIIPAGQIGVYSGQSVGPANPDLLQKGNPADLDGFQLVYQNDAKFSGFQVTHDPANALIWIASGLFILGLAVVFYFPYRRVWLKIQPESDGSRALLRLEVPRGFNSSAELKTLVNEIQNQHA